MLNPRQLIFESGNLLLKNSYLMGVLSFYLFDPVKRLLLPCSGALPLGAPLFGLSLQFDVVHFGECDLCVGKGGFHRVRRSPGMGRKFGENHGGNIVPLEKMGILGLWVHGMFTKELWLIR